MASHLIGIDLGTTYSAVSTIDEYGRPCLLDNTDGERLTPSAVCFRAADTPLVGMEAKEMMDAGDENVTVFFKRTMGDPNYRFTAFDHDYTPSDLSAILLKRLVEGAERAVGASIDGAVITVPAYYGNAERCDVIEAARKAGINLISLCNEPTAAALCYGTLHKLNGYYLVYDLGGGTFDVSVLEAHGTDIRILAVDGDHHLGGKDWDDMIVNRAVEQFREEFGDDLSEDFEAFNQLLFQAEKLKIQLSSRDTASMTVRYRGNRMRFELTRAEFEKLTEYLMETTTMKATQALQNAGLTWESLEGVLLVGGSTRMPVVSEWVRRMSGKAPLSGVNPDEAVCMGAAVLAAINHNQPRFGIGGSKPAEQRYAIAGAMKLTDVMSHSLGVVAVSSDGERYVNSILIPRNVPIPATETRTFEHYTRPGAPNELQLYVTQGETADLHSCTFDALYEVPSIPHHPSGRLKVDISYSYDSSGVIHVEVRDTESRRSFDVERRPLPDDMDWLYQKPKGKSGPMDVVILIDESGSMWGKPMKKAQEAAHEFVARLNLDNARVAVCGFTHYGNVHCELTSDKRAIDKAIDKLKADGGNGYDALLTGHKLLRKRAKGTKGIMIVLTDGEWYAGNGPYQTSDQCRDEQIDIIAIGFGSANKAFLKRISTISVLTDLDSLSQNFSNIAHELSSGNDVGRIKLV